jgi:medium-chain acyl-[acyl-carrier-protein] hydrolase
MSVAAGVSPFLVRFEARPSASSRLLCFPHAGGSATAFATWHRYLPPEIEVWGVQLPGRDSRHTEAPITSMEYLIARLADGARALHDRPLALFGHSLGGLIAFEYARHLRRAGLLAPQNLLVSAVRAPQHARASVISHLPRAEFLNEVTRRYDGIPKLILESAEMLEYFLPILRADLALLESYRYAVEPPLACPIVAFGGASDPRVHETELALWRSQTETQFAARLFPGKHFYLTSARDALLATICEVLRPLLRDDVQAFDGKGIEWS